MKLINISLRVFVVVVSVVVKDSKAGRDRDTPNQTRHDQEKTSGLNAASEREGERDWVPVSLSAWPHTQHSTARPHMHTAPATATALVSSGMGRGEGVVRSTVLPRARR